MEHKIRTDLALEVRDMYKKAQNIEDEIPGIETKIDDSIKDILVTKVSILSEEGATALNKPIGEYITIESPYMNDEVNEIDEKIISKIAETIKDISHIVKKDSVLIVGLGNNDITPDALGPKVAENVQVTRHLVEYAPELLPDGAREISSVIPGVLGTTGIETSDIVKAIVSKISPDLIIVIDALAAKNMNKISRTIQISNTGITPGSGVKNTRFSINKETMGVPVLAIGIPTVVGVPTIVSEAISYVLDNEKEIENNGDSENNKIDNYMQEILSNEKFDFMVTPNEIDDIISNMSRLLADGINKALN